MRVFLIFYLLFNCLLFSQVKTKSNEEIAFGYLEKNEYKKAIEYFLIAIENKEVNENYYYTVGYCYNSLNDFNNTILYLEKFLALDKINVDSVLIYSTLIECYFNLDKLKDALKYYKLAKEKDVNYEDKFLRFEMEGFRYLTSAECDDIYYQIKTIKKNDNSVVKVWFKKYWDSISIPPQDYDNIFNSCQENGYFDQIKFETMLKNKRAEIAFKKNNEIYRMSLEEYDCKERKVRLLSFTSYDKDGRPIESFDASEYNAKSIAHGWSYVVPASVGEGILNIICGIK